MNLKDVWKKKFQIKGKILFLNLLKVVFTLIHMSKDKA